MSRKTGRSLNVDAIIRSGLARFSDEVGPLWCKLADFYIRSGAFERARDVFEEAINSVPCPVVLAFLNTCPFVQTTLLFDFFDACGEATSGTMRSAYVCSLASLNTCTLSWFV